MLEFRQKDDAASFPGQLVRAAVELAKLWRTDKYLRKLDVSEGYVMKT